MTNSLTLICDSVECNGYPHAEIKINDSIVYSGIVDDCKNKFDIPISSAAGKHTLSIQRYGKNEKNTRSDFCQHFSSDIRIDTFGNAPNWTVSRFNLQAICQYTRLLLACCNKNVPRSANYWCWS